MSTFRANSGLSSGFGGNAAQQSGNMWRPWTGQETQPAAPTAHSVNGDLSVANQTKVPHFVHPVKLFWPKTRCFDYLYRDAEMLLRNYPVQATICLYEDSSSDEDEEEDEEEEEEEEEEEVEMEKELN